MLSISLLIEFLLDLLRSDEARAEFEQDPEGALARHGLAGVSGQDVRDARTILGDQSGVYRTSGGSSSDDDHGSPSYYREDSGGRGSPSYHRAESGDRESPSYHRKEADDHASRPRHHERDDDPVKEVHHVTNNYAVDKSVTADDVYNTYTEFNVFYVDNSTNVVNIDDRDTLIVGENVEVSDSFNSENNVTVIDDSLNGNNFGVDTGGGDITGSGVAGGDMDASETTTVQDSFNDVDVTAISAENSFNSNDTIVNESFNETTLAESSDETTVDDESSNETAAEETTINQSLASDTAVQSDSAENSGDEAGADAAAVA